MMYPKLYSIYLRGTIIFFGVLDPARGRPQADQVVRSCRKLFVANWLHVRVVVSWSCCSMKLSHDVFLPLRWEFVKIISTQSSSGTPADLQNPIIIPIYF